MLTDTAIRALKPGPRPIKKSGGGSLFILVTPEGSKHWRLAYRFLGKQKPLSGGPYPLVKPADARKWRDEAKLDLLAGRDPSAVRKAAKKALKAASENSFETIAMEWIDARRCACSPRFIRVIENRLSQKPIEGPATWPCSPIGCCIDDGSKPYTSGLGPRRGQHLVAAAADGEMTSKDILPPGCCSATPVLGLPARRPRLVSILLRFVALGFPSVRRAVRGVSAIVVN